MKQLFLIRAKENLLAADLLYNKELFNASVNRAYYSIFHVLLAALFDKGYNPSIEHRTATSMFCNEFINKRKSFPSFFKKLVYELQDARNKADYGTGVSRKMALNRLKDTKQLFESITKEIGK